MSAQLAPVVRLLTVRTGERLPFALCRAAARVRVEPGQTGRFVVTSAGTHALVGAPVDSGSAKLLLRKGFQYPAFGGPG